MYRLSTIGEKNKSYKYISKELSETIIKTIDYYLKRDDENHFNFIEFYDKYFDDMDFFIGISDYIKSDINESEDFKDWAVGLTFTEAKLIRMKEKMLDKDNFYTFDLFEERLLFLMLYDLEGKENKVFLNSKEKIKKSFDKLCEVYKWPKTDARKISKVIHSPKAILKAYNEEDMDIVFWDTDHEIFFEDGFLEGIDRLRNIGPAMGYDYENLKEIFTDIGLKAPLMLIGTEVANKELAKINEEKFVKAQNEFWEEMTKDIKER